MELSDRRSSPLTQIDPYGGLVRGDGSQLVAIRKSTRRHHHRIVGTQIP